MICQSCAAKLGRICPGCQDAVPTSARFCGNCGFGLPAPTRTLTPRIQSEVTESLRALMPRALTQKLQRQKIEIESERREVTVLMLDVTNYTASFHGMDSEDTYLVLDEALRLLVEPLYEFEGTLDKFTGDGFMGLFGAPLAHENDPERGVRAALRMQKLVVGFQNRIKQEHGLDFQVRIGLATGEVVAGRVGSDSSTAYTVMGNTANLAARLESAAAPGTVLVDVKTYQRTRGIIEYEIVPPLRLKGMPEPVPAFRPVRVQDRASQLRGLPGLRVPLIGRQEPLATLDAARKRVTRDSCSQVVVVSGAAGVGKSRLVDSFKESLSEDRYLVLHATCHDYARNRPHWLVAGLLRDLIEVTEHDPPEVQRGRLTEMVRLHGLNEEEVIPYLLYLLSLPQADSDQEQRLALHAPEMRQSQSHAALRQLLVTLAWNRPTVLVLDDLHWIDPASRNLLEHVIDASNALPLLMIFIYRVAERQSVLGPLLERVQALGPRHVAIDLEPLSTTAGRRLVDELLPEETDAARALKRRLVERAEGNPWYTEELIRMLVDQGVVGHDGEHLTVGPGAREALDTVPETLKGLVLGRFDRLPDRLRRTLQRVVVLGPSFPAEILPGYMEAPASAIEIQMEDLIARNFLLLEPIGGEPGYGFRHPLIQEAIYATLLKRDQQVLHDRAAEVVGDSQVLSEEVRTEALAYHYNRGSNPSLAIPHLLQAARHAMRRYANETSVQHFQRALDLLCRHPEQFDIEFYDVRMGLAEAFKLIGQLTEATEMLERLIKYLRADESSEGPRLHLLISAIVELSDIRIREGQLDEALAMLREARKRLGDPNATEHPHLWASVIDRLAVVYLRQGKTEQVFDLVLEAEGLRELAVEEDPLTWASLFNSLGGSYWQQGQQEKAIDYVRRSLDLYESQGYLYGVANAHNSLGILEARRGGWAPAVEHFERADTLRKRIGAIQNRSENLEHLGFLRMAMGQHEAARKELEDSLSIRVKLGDVYGQAHSLANLAQLALIQMRLSDAERLGHEAIQQSLASGAHEAHVHAQWVLGMTRAETGEPEGGLRQVEAGLEMAREFGLTERAGDCLRAIGMILGQMERFGEAQSAIGDALHYARENEDPYRIGLGLLELGRLILAGLESGAITGAGQRSAAYESLTGAIEQFESLGATYDLYQARQSLTRYYRLDLQVFEP